MLPKEKRLSSSGFSREILVRAKLFCSQNLKMRYLEGPELKAAVIVSNRVHKNAVVRITIRRKLYELIRTYKDQPGGTIIVQVNKDVSGLGAAELKAELWSLFERIV